MLYENEPRPHVHTGMAWKQIMMKRQVQAFITNPNTKTIIMQEIIQIPMFLLRHVNQIIATAMPNDHGTIGTIAEPRMFSSRTQVKLIILFWGTS